MVLPSPQQQIKQLQHWQQIALITAMAERNLTNYQLFSEVCEFGDPKVLRQNLNLLWDCAAGIQSAKNFEKQLDLLEENTPDPLAFDGYGAYPALDECVLINSALCCAMKESYDEVLNAQRLSFSTVAQLIEFTEHNPPGDADTPEEESLDLQDHLQQHSLYQQEQAFQNTVIDQLLSAKNPTKALIQSLRSLAQNNGVSSIGIAME